jgi:hypothetical protein
MWMAAEGNAHGDLFNPINLPKPVPPSPPPPQTIPLPATHGGYPQ